MEGTKLDKSKQIERAEEKLLHEFGLENIQNNLGMVLSGGERRRTEIARALATEPKFILLRRAICWSGPYSSRGNSKHRLFFKEEKNWHTDN